MFEIIVSQEQSKQRLDKWLAYFDFIPSRSRAAELIERGYVTLNGTPLKPAQKIAAGLIVRIELPEPEPSELVAWDAPLEILFEDADVIVVNKPSGLVVHPAAGHAQDTLVNILLHHVDSLSMGFNKRRPGIVHRLDRDTSGVIVVAKNDFAHVQLARQFKEKSTHRIYWAIVHGHPPATGTLRSLLARHPTDRKRFSSHPTKGKIAVTHFRTLKSTNDHAWMELRLETGRTHQIRVHLSEKGWPILGDPIYGAKQRDRKQDYITRLALHAGELAFDHPRSGERLSFSAPWPEELDKMARAVGLV